MNPELEALIQAYDALKQASPGEVEALRVAYDARIEKALQRCPNLYRTTLESMVRFARDRWLKAQGKPSSLPPRA